MDLRRKIDLFYKKYPMGRWGLISVGGFIFLGLLICQIGATDFDGCSLCLIVGGFLSIFFLVGLGLYIEGKFAGPLAKLAMLSGIFCSISLMGVGIFPWNVNRPMHNLVVVFFFVSASVTAGIFSLAIFLQDVWKANQKLPRWFGFGGIVVAIVEVIFLQQDFGTLVQIAVDNPGCREGLVPVTFWEWMVFYAVSIWMIVISYLTRNKTTEKSAKKTEKDTD